MTRADRIAGGLGWLGAAGNVVGVVFLAEVPAAYRPGTLDAWAAQAASHPAASAASAAAFILGLLALAGWARGLAAVPGMGGAGTAIAAGAVVNAAGCVTPLVLLYHLLPGCAPGACGPEARALLGLTVALDAFFNLLLGLGLLAAGRALWRGGSRGLGGLGLAAGLATLPVSLQVVSDGAARLLALAGPLWLAFVVATGVALWRGTLAADAPEAR